MFYISEVSHEAWNNILKSIILITHFSHIFMYHLIFMDIYETSWSLHLRLLIVIIDVICYITYLSWNQWIFGMREREITATLNITKNSVIYINDMIMPNVNRLLYCSREVVCCNTYTLILILIKMLLLKMHWNGFHPPLMLCFSSFLVVSRHSLGNNGFHPQTPYVF